jgi:hypothetical protein
VIAPEQSPAPAHETIHEVLIRILTLLLLL